MSEAEGERAELAHTIHRRVWRIIEILDSTEISDYLASVELEEAATLAEQLRLSVSRARDRRDGQSVCSAGGGSLKSS